MFVIVVKEGKEAEIISKSRGGAGGFELKSGEEIIDVDKEEERS